MLCSLLWFVVGLVVCGSLLSCRCVLFVVCGSWFVLSCRCVFSLSVLFVCRCFLRCVVCRCVLFVVGGRSLLLFVCLKQFLVGCCCNVLFVVVVCC